MTLSNNFNTNTAKLNSLEKDLRSANNINDYRLGGVKVGEIIIYAARAKGGKSMFNK